MEDLIFDELYFPRSFFVLSEFLVEDVLVVCGCLCAIPITLFVVEWTNFQQSHPSQVLQVPVLQLVGEGLGRFLCGLSLGGIRLVLVLHDLDERMQVLWCSEHKDPLGFILGVDACCY